MMLIIVFVVFVIAHYWVVGIRAPWSPRLEAPPLPASVVGMASGRNRGRRRVFWATKAVSIATPCQVMAVSRPPISRMLEIE